jgi:hypothetical integral membrane protein (TIGR02206 family)
MPGYFFKYLTDIPSEFYTPNFSPTHLAWLFCAVLLTVLSPLVYRRRSQPARDRILKALVVFIVAGEIATWIWKLMIGRFDVRESLPLHLCNISIFVEFFAVFLKRSALLKEFSYALSMPSALAALITPGWYYPIVSFQYLISALTHTILVLVPVLLVWGDGFRPDIRRLPKVSVLFILFIALAVTSNIIFGSNYMFLAYVPQDTVLVNFQTWFGNPGYELAEFLLLLIIWTILYLPRIVSGRRVKKRLN